MKPALLLAAGRADRLLRAALAALPPPAAVRTSWDEISCTSVLVQHSLIVGGDLHVNGRIQVLASSNLTVFEEGDAEELQTNQLSRFAQERCSRRVVNPTASAPAPVLAGDLILPHANLILGGELLMVGGTISAKGLTLDGASLAVVNARPLLEAGKCPAGKGATALKVAHGLVHLKNGSELRLYGTLEAPAIGIDRGGQLDIACGGIRARDASGENPGDVAVLGSSSLSLHSSTGIEGHSLVVGESSLFKTDGAVRVDTLKVTGYATALVSSSVVAADMLLVTAHSYLRLAALKALAVRTAAVVAQGAALQIDSAGFSTLPSFEERAALEAAVGTEKNGASLLMELNALELADGGALRAAPAHAEITEHLSIDGFSRLEIDGAVAVGAWTSVANFSRARFEHGLDVGESLQIKAGSEVVVTRSLQVACGVVVSGASKLRARALDLRADAMSTEALSERLEECLPLTPALLVSQNANVTLTRLSLNGTAFINARSALAVETVHQASGGLLLKRESIAAVSSGLEKTQFIDVSGLSSANIATTALIAEGVRVEDSSALHLKAQKVDLGWLDVHSRSRLEIEAESLLVQNEAVVEEVSSLKVVGGSVQIKGGLLSAVRSASQLGGKCQHRIQLAMCQLRDASEASIAGTFVRGTHLKAEVLSGSTIALTCPVRDGVAQISRSSDSNSRPHASWKVHAENVSLAVPPSESVPIKHLTPKTVVDAFNTTRADSTLQRKAKASGWKMMEKLAAAVDAAPLAAAAPAAAPLPPAEEAPRRAASSSKRRKKDD